MSGRKWSLRLQRGRRDRGSGAPVTDQRRRQVGSHSFLCCGTRVSATAVTAFQPSPTSRVPYEFSYVPITVSRVLTSFPQVIYSSEVWFTTLSAEGYFPRRIQSCRGQSEHDTSLLFFKQKTSFVLYRIGPYGNLPLQHWVTCPHMSWWGSCCLWRYLLGSEFQLGIYCSNCRFGCKRFLSQPCNVHSSHCLR